MVKRKGTRKYKQNINKTWFNDECKRKKKVYYKAWKKSDKNKNSATLKAETKKAAKSYKKQVKKCKRLFDMLFAENLRKLKSNDPKAYWKILNSKNYNKQTKQPTLEEFF